MARSHRRSSADRSQKQAAPAAAGPSMAPASMEDVPAPAADTLGATLSGFAAQLGLADAPPVDEASGRAESMDAAAVAQNGGVAVNRGVVETGADLAPLMAHEAVHLAQAKVDGPEAAETDLEAEADAGAEALLAGKPFRPQHATKGQRPLKKGLADWFVDEMAERYSKWEEEPEKHVEAWKEGRLRRTWAQESEELPETDRSRTVENKGITSERDTYMGTDEVVEDAANPWAEPSRRKVSGTQHHPPDGEDTSYTRAHKDTDEAGNERYTTDDVAYERKPFGNLEMSDHRNTVETLDVGATRSKVKEAMAARRAPLEGRYMQAGSALEKTRKNLASTRNVLANLEADPNQAQGQAEAFADGVQSPEVRIPKLKEKIARYEARASELDIEVKDASDALREHDAEVGGLGDDPDALIALIQKHKLKVEKQFKKVETHEGETTTTDKATGVVTTRNGSSTSTDEFVEGTSRGQKRSTFKGTETTLDKKNLKASWGSVDSTVDEVDREDHAGSDKTHDINKRTATVDLKNKTVGAAATTDRKGPGKAEAKASVSGDVAWKDGKLVGSAKSSKRVRTERGGVLESNSATTVDKDGASHNTDVGGGFEGDHISAKAKVSRNGAFKVVVTPVPGDPPTYTLVTTITMGAGLGGGVEGSRKGDSARKNSFTDGDRDTKLGVNVGGGLSANYTHTRTLSLEEAKSYLSSVDAVDAGGTPTSSLPEFAIGAKFVAAAKEGAGAENLGAVVGSSEGARSMREGDSLSLELGADVQGGLNASADGDGSSVGATVSGKAGWKRTVSVARGKGDEVIVTVSRVNESGSTLGATASSGHASGGASRSEASSSGESVKIRLSTADPTYDSKFGAITGAMTLDAVRDLKKRYQADVIAFERSNSESTEDKGNVDLPGVSFNVGDKSAYRESVSVDNGGAGSGSFTGSAGSSADLKVGGITVAGSERSTSITADTNAAGDTTVDLENKEVEHSPDAVDPKLEFEKGDLDKLAKLKDAVQKAETRLSGYRLSTSDLNTLTQRSRNTVLWEKCANSSAYSAWTGLATDLSNPKPDAEWAEIDREQAERLARAKALARFAQASGPDGGKCLDKALRHWGEGTYSLEQDDLGEGYEWPPSISTKKPAYTKARKDVDGFQGQFGGWLGLADGLQTEIAAMENLSRTLAELQNAVQGAQDYANPQLRGELLQALSTARSTLRHDHAEFVDLWQTAHGQEAADPEALLDGDAERRVKDLERVVKGLKADETRLLDEVEAELDATWYTNDGVCRANLASVRQSYGFWQQQIQELRMQYAAAGIDGSAGILPARGAPGAPSASTPLPDVARFTRLDQRFNNFDADAAAQAPEGSALQDQQSTYEHRKRTLEGM